MMTKSLTEQKFKALSESPSHQLITRSFFVMYSRTTLMVLFTCIHAAIWASNRATRDILIPLTRYGARLGLIDDSSTKG
jgi:hypothetical protein